MKRLFLPVLIGVGMLLLALITAGWMYVRSDINHRQQAMIERYAGMGHQERFLDQLERSERMAESLGDPRSTALYSELRKHQEEVVRRDLERQGIIGPGDPLPGTAVSAPAPTPVAPRPAPPPPSGDSASLMLLGGSLALILLLTIGGLVGAGVYFTQQDRAEQAPANDGVA